MTTTKKSLIRNGGAVSYLAAAFALAGAMAISPVSQALAGETNLAAKAGDTLTDGTIYAGNNFAATPADAPGLYWWTESKRYCEDLTANGHDDWAMPTREQLNHLYENTNTGGFAGTFNKNSSSLAHLYWSSTERVSHSSFAWIQSFTDGDGGWVLKGNGELSVRCVRSIAP